MCVSAPRLKPDRLPICLLHGTPHRIGALPAGGNEGVSEGHQVVRISLSPLTYASARPALQVALAPATSGTDRTRIGRVALDPDQRIGMYPKRSADKRRKPLRDVGHARAGVVRSLAGDDGCAPVVERHDFQTAVRPASVQALE